MEKMSNEQLRPIIDEILGYYFNQKTRMNWSTKVQNNMVGQNQGLRNACSAVISFAEDEDELVEYTRDKIKKLTTVRLKR